LNDNEILTGGVEDVELLNSVTVRYKVSPDDEWQRAEMVMRDDYDDNGIRVSDVVTLDLGALGNATVISVRESLTYE
jgi:hypothetical protein